MPPKKTPKKSLPAKVKSPEASKTKRILAPSKRSHPFSSWKDEDFYSAKASHVFLYGEINTENVQKLRNNLYEASKTSKSKDGVIAKPRPIIIHIHSSGGFGDLGITIANFIREVPVPVAIVVDGYACSAATPLLVSAQYRVMHEFSFVMFHEMSITFYGRMQDSDLSYHQGRMRTTFDEYHKVYQANTKMPPAILDDMLTRDIFMDSTTCDKYKVVDRVIKLSKNHVMDRWSKYMNKYPEMAFGKDPSTWKVNINHLYTYDSHVDNLFSSSAIMDSLLQVIKPMHAVMADRSASDPMPIMLHANQYITPRSYMFDLAAVMIHTYTMRSPVISIIDNNIDIMRAMPCILSYKRYMYDNVYLTIALVYAHNSLPLRYYHDIKYNSELLRASLIKILKQYTKMPQSMLSNLFDSRVVLTAQQCKEYGIVDEIIPTGAQLRSGMSGGCGCSQGLSYF